METQSTKAAVITKNTQMLIWLWQKLSCCLALLQEADVFIVNGVIPIGGKVTQYWVGESEDKID